MTIINNALSGAQAAQAALSVASQNIANVMTEGYTRQGVLMSSVVARGAGMGGDGVEVPSLIRFSDSYKSQQLWQAAASQARYATVQPYMTQLEQVMGDDGSSINNGLDGYFAALNAASVEPNSNPLRQQVITAAEALAQRFNNMTQVLTNQRASVAQQRTTVAAQINTTTAGIAELNRKIALAQGAGLSSSELIDARDLQIDKLSAMVALNVVDQPDGTRSLMLKGGQPLVIGSTASTLVMQGNPDGSQSIHLDFASQRFEVRERNLGGQLGGLDHFENEVLLPLRQSIGDMASAVADEFNAVFAAGYAPDGSPGVPLFRFDASSGVGTLAVHDVTASQLAFSASPTEPGNNANLLALIGLKDLEITVASLGLVRLGDANTQLVGKLGMDSQQNEASLSTARTVRNQATESWKSTSGVNTDEEAVNLMQYQQMYQANLKVMAVANELFDSMLASF